MKVFLLLTLILLQTITSANAAPKSLSCSLQGMKDTITFMVPAKMGEMPRIDFPYPVKSIIFSLTASNLILVAIANDEQARPRLFLSAQYQKNLHAYVGQFMTDYGGNQLQIDNGPVICK